MGISNLAGSGSSSASAASTSGVQKTYQGPLHRVYPPTNGTIARVTGGGDVVDYKAMSNDLTWRYVMSRYTPTHTPSPNFDNYSNSKQAIHFNNPQCVLLVQEYYLYCVDATQPIGKYDGVTSPNNVLDHKPLLNGTGYPNTIADHLPYYLERLSDNSAILIAYKIANTGGTSPAGMVAYIISVNSAGQISVTSPVSLPALSSLNESPKFTLLPGTTQIIGTYWTSSNATFAFGISVSGTTITIGTSLNLSIASYYMARLAPLSGTQAALVYHPNSFPTSATLVKLTVSSNTITSASQSITYPTTLLDGETISGGHYLDVQNIGTNQLLFKLDCSNNKLVCLAYDCSGTATLLASRRFSPSSSGYGTWYTTFPENLQVIDVGDSSKSTFMIGSTGSGSGYTPSSFIVLVVYDSSLTGVNKIQFKPYQFGTRDIVFPNQTASSFGFDYPTLRYDAKYKKIFAAQNCNYNGSYYVQNYKVLDVSDWLAGKSFFAHSLHLSNALQIKNSYNTITHFTNLYFHPATDYIVSLYRGVSSASDDIIDVLDKSILNDKNSYIVIGFHSANGLVHTEGFVKISNVNLSPGQTYYFTSTDELTFSSTTNSLPNTKLGKAVSNDTIFLADPPQFIT